MKKQVFPLAVITILFAFSSNVPAASLFSVDINTDELVRIETTTGQVDVIGSLGINVVDIDLATVSNAFPPEILAAPDVCAGLVL